MDIAFRDKALELWRKFFGGAPLPIIAYYSDQPVGQAARPRPGWHCFVGDLAAVRAGGSLCVDVDSIGCFGGKRYLGFSDAIRPGFEFFLSCGIPGKVEGERYKSSPELVRQLMAGQPFFKALGKYMVIKRWDGLTEADRPEIVIVLAGPDVLAGLFTLANFDEADPNAVICPFGAGCATLVHYPYLEREKEHPRSVIGMFDVSARMFVTADVLSFATPMAKFMRMVGNMEQSFLTTKSWSPVRGRIGQ